MEAVTAIIKNLLQNVRTVLILGVVLGLALGLIIGWGIWPVTYTDTTPEILRTDLQEDYLRMAMESYSRTGDQQTAINRWNSLGTAAQPTLQRLQPSVDPTLFQQFATAVQAPVLPGGATPTTPAVAGCGLSTWVTAGAGFGGGGDAVPSAFVPQEFRRCNARDAGSRDQPPGGED
jgi:hypothetical protein